MRRALIPLLGLVLAGVTWELLDLTRVLPTASAPGDEPSGGFLVGVAMYALLLEAILYFVLASRGSWPTLAWLMAPLAGALALCHIYSYDSYCGGYGCTFLSETGTGAERWTWTLAGACVLIGILAWRRVSISVALSGMAAIAAWVTVATTPLGH